MGNFSANHTTTTGDAPVHRPLAFIPRKLPPYAIILRIDRQFENQVIKGPQYKRSRLPYDHTTLTVVTPDETICVGFQPKDPIQLPPPKPDPVFQNNMLGLIGWAAHTLLKPISNTIVKADAAFTCVAGCVRDEDDRYHDACIVYERTPEQIAKALATIERWRAQPPFYQAAAKLGHNCVTFNFAVMESADISVPSYLKDNPYPQIVDLHIGHMARAHALASVAGHAIQTGVYYYPDHAIDSIARRLTRSNNPGYSPS